MISSKFNPRQGLEYHKMKSAILTVDENRRKIKSGGFAQTHYIDENHKKLDENYKKTPILNSSKHKMKSTSLTLDENRKKFKSGRFAQTLRINENYKKLASPRAAVAQEGHAG